MSKYQVNKTLYDQGLNNMFRDEVEHGFPCSVNQHVSAYAWTLIMTRMKRTRQHATIAEQLELYELIRFIHNMPAVLKRVGGWDNRVRIAICYQVK